MVLPWSTSHLLSEDDVALHQLFGQTHGVLQVDVVILGAVYHHQAAVPHIVTHSSHTRPEEDNKLSSEKKSNHQDASNLIKPKRHDNDLSSEKRSNYQDASSLIKPKRPDMKQLLYRMLLV